MSWQGDSREAGTSRKSRVPLPNEIADRILDDHDLVTDDAETTSRHRHGFWREIRKIHLAQLALDIERRYS